MIRLMSLSKKLQIEFEKIDAKSRTKLVKMAWSDKISFQEIKKLYGFSANQVEKFMRYSLSERDYIRWKKRREKIFNQKSRKASKLREIG